MKNVSSSVIKWLSTRYCDVIMIDTNILYEEFKKRFGRQGVAYSAPGRINLIGEHTDYNGGFVFPGAVEQSITAVVSPNGSGVVNAYAMDLQLEASFAIDDPKDRRRCICAISMALSERCLPPVSPSMASMSSMVAMYHLGRE